MENFENKMLIALNTTQLRKKISVLMQIPIEL